MVAIVFKCLDFGQRGLSSMATDCRAVIGLPFGCQAGAFSPIVLTHFVCSVFLKVPFQKYPLVNMPCGL